MTIKLLTKFFSVVGVILLAIASLVPADWLSLLRTGHWEIEHFLVTSIVCLTWPRPFVVGGALMAVAALLEGLQGLTPDRTPDLMGAIWGAVGALAAALHAELIGRLRSGRGVFRGDRIR